MRLGVIDIGSNTIKITVFNAAKRPEEIFSKTVHAKLSSHITDERLSQKGISVLVRSVNALKRTARIFDCKKQNIFAFATACIRGASNRGVILAIASKCTKMNIRLLSGDEEAELCFLGAISSDGCPTSGVLADLGGGSCEFIEFENSASRKKISLNIGALAMYKKFASGKYISTNELKNLSEHLENELESSMQIKIPENGDFIVTGGTARTAVKLLSEIEGKKHTLPCTVTLDKARELCERITSGELLSLTEQTVKDRSETLVPGLTVFIKAAEMLGASSFTVVEGGARTGFAKHIICDRG